jgi:hypothetical protein
LGDLVTDASRRSWLWWTGTAAFSALFLPPAAACIWALQRIIETNVNHTGVNVLWFEPPLLLAAGVAWLMAERWHSRGYLVLCIAAIVLALLVWLTYQHNVLLPYEVWIDRGKPDRSF